MIFQNSLSKPSCKKLQKKLIFFCYQLSLSIIILVRVFFLFFILQSLIFQTVLSKKNILTIYIVVKYSFHKISKQFTFWLNLMQITLFDVTLKKKKSQG